MTTTEIELAAPFLEKVDAYLPDKGQKLVRQALEFAAESHAGQLRKNGDPVITHPLSAATTVAELQLDAATIAGALLHDVQEDCGVSNAEISKRFGGEVALMVEGVTKLGLITDQAADAEAVDKQMQAENLRKMFLAMAQDLRVVIIKLADRLHNMRTLWGLSREDQVRIARETMEIYAPLAARLGIWEIKWQLEDLAFRYLQPDEYKRLAEMLEVKRKVREQYVAEVCEILRDELDKQGVKAEVYGRAKHIYSIHKKVEKYAAERRDVDEIYDLLAVRILVDDVTDCYSALGVVHGMWRPLPGTFDDYIANPKESMYQSLHTTVMALNTQPLEVQIRTYEMHRQSEFGIAAHWRYKEGGTKRDELYEERLAWLRQLLDWQREMSQAEELIEAVKTDIFQDQVFIFTPKGEIKDMPAGSTPLDFAYRIHTDLGHMCVGAKVNGRLVSLNYQIKNGEVVEIVTSKSSKGPSRDWMNANLGYLRTTHAREKVRQWFKKQQRAENIAKGKEAVERELARLGTDLPDMEKDILKIFKFDDIEDFFLRVGYGEISTQQISNKMASLIQESDDVLEFKTPQAAQTVTGIRVLGTGDLLTKLARCCNPVPGDAITGYVTRGEGVSIHRSDCTNILREDEPERLVAVEWGQRGQMYPVAVHIDAWDRVGLLRDVATMVAEERVNMVGVHTQEAEDGHITIYVTLETSGIEQLSRLLNKLEGIRGVLSVSRRLQGSRKSA
jgi:GTP pyrophosphokinase